MTGWGVALALAVATLGCAGAHLPIPEPDATLDRAVDDLERGDHAAAVAELVSLAGPCPATPVERYALLLATSASIDPRNPSRDLNGGAALAARYLAHVPTDGAGGRSLAQALYLLALELGAQPPPVAAEACGAVSDTLTLPTAVPTMPQRIRALERELAGLREELARIRKTLEP
ncbi:MAG: hypothetical protein ACREMJ_07805 [Gemmatimonadales bacterium]